MYLSVLSFVICLSTISGWTAHNYWNRYSASGVNYNDDDSTNGMWSDDGSPYLPIVTGVPYCRGCSCKSPSYYYVELGSCTDNVNVGGYTILDTLNSTTFPETVKTISIFGCSFSKVDTDPFANKANLTTLIIRRVSQLTFMPDITGSQITMLNLIGNSIATDSKYKGSLPSTIEYLALTSNKIHWLPKHFVSGPNLRLVSLGDNLFTNIPELGDLPNIMYFGIETNKLTQISLKHLSPLSSNSFIHLNLSNNAIKTIQRGTFQQLHNLKILELHNNKLSKIPRGIFENLRELVHLDIDHNSLKELTSRAFVNLESLVEFRLQSQSPSMTTVMFDSMINVGKSLKYLFISSNSLTHIPHQVFLEANFTSLVELHADRNSIHNVTELHESFYGVKLRATYLERAKKFIPFSTTPHIEKLYLQHNLIEGINNADFCEMPSLQYLYLEHNSLNEKNIQKEGFKCLPSLIYLRLNNNKQMQCVPGALTTNERLPAILYLFLEYNQISFINAKTFSNVSTLQDLYLHSNNIIAIEDDTFPVQLRTLTLNNNKFRFIHRRQFANLPMLNSLNLNSNEITFIPDDAFKNTTSLKSLSMSSNKIVQIKKKSFEDCPLSIQLLLGSNEIGYIEDGTLDHITFIGTLDFANNRLYRLPRNGTFHNKAVSNLYLHNNRISNVLADTFIGITVNSFSINGNRISSIKSGAFRRFYVSNHLSLIGNKLRLIETNAFNDVSAHIINVNGVHEVQPYGFIKVTCSYFYMQNSEIDTILSYTFNNFNCRSCNLNNNKVYLIQRHAFNDFRSSDYMSFSSNRLMSLDNTIFGGSSNVYRLLIDNNQLERISTEAFLNMNGNSYLSIQNNNLYIYPSALKVITPLEINLSNNKITEIPTGSIDNQYRLQKLYLHGNQMSHIQNGLLTLVTNLHYLDFSSNAIRKVDEGAFDGLYYLQNLYLSDNIIPYFPGVTLPRLEYLFLFNNKIETLAKIDVGTNIKSVNLNNNYLGCECSTVEALIGVENVLSQNTACFSPAAVHGALFARSQRSHLRYYGNYKRSLFQCSGESIVATKSDSGINITLFWTRPMYLYTTVNSSYADIRTAEKLTNEKYLWTYNVTCTSDTAATLFKSITAEINCNYNIVCGNHTGNETSDQPSTTVPTSLSSNNYGDFYSLPSNSFENITSTKLSTHFSSEGTTSSPENYTKSPNVTDNKQASCKYTISTLICPNSTEHNATVTFTSDDSVSSNTLYECVIQLEVDNYVSAKSVPSFVKTGAIGLDSTPDGGNITENDQNMFIEMTYYDFSVDHNDFKSDSGLLSQKPFHIVSPLGSWLAFSKNLLFDTFSDWFRSASSNIVIQGGITLKPVGNDTSSRRFYANEFFPVDNLGFGNEGQTDCKGMLHNFAFTSVLRSGITYAGSEEVTIGGGEEMWLFINKVLVLEIIANRSSNEVICHKIKMKLDGKSFLSYAGILINDECMSLAPLAEKDIQLDLVIGRTYLFELFHTERRPCTSEFYIHLENVKLSIGKDDIPASNYMFEPKENSSTNMIVGVFNVWDVFAVGTSFEVEILSGNEGRYFSILNDTLSNRNLLSKMEPPVLKYENIPGTDVSYAVCEPLTSPSPSSFTSMTELYPFTKQNVLIVLKKELDYELEQSYRLDLRVKDLVSGLFGKLIIAIEVEDINDNCPSLKSPDILTPELILQKGPLFTILAEDKDSGINSQVQFFLSPFIGENPSISYDGTLDIQKTIYNHSTELELTVFGIDMGIPPRGSSVNVTLKISNTCLIDETFARMNISIFINESTGGLYFRAPGYWTFDFNCSDYIGIANGLIRDNQLTASSTRSQLTYPGRARLGLNASDPVLGPLSGGWIAAMNDNNQYIDVNMEEIYIIKKIHIQGQQDEPNWVTAFQIYFVDNTTGNWTLYHEYTGEYKFLGSYDQNTIKTVECNPPIYSQYIRINPRNWTNNIALRLEFSGCALSRKYHYETSCERCYTSNYCPGDGESHACGRCKNTTGLCNRNPTEHSFGVQAECTPCPDGWICKDGYAIPCQNLTYVLFCNETYCPENCTDCEPGYACRGGQRYVCLPGTYSDGRMEVCSTCPEGYYQDEYGQLECKKCPAGYFSGKSKDRCNPCDRTTYSLGIGDISCTTCNSALECPCLRNDTCFEMGQNRAGCINTGYGAYQCFGCPPGFTGDGVTCVDIDECTSYKPCWNTSACINTIPGYQCLACPYGYIGTYEDGLAWNDTVRVFEKKNMEVSQIQDQRCADINECLDNNGSCDRFSPCVNTMGSFYCGFCAEGYSGNPSISCYSTNYCQTGQHTCSEYATCIYLGPKEYKCECNMGYTGSGEYCGLDSDLDGHPDVTLHCTEWRCFGDNCRSTPNCGQEDADGDRIGDDCDADSDNDGTIDKLDNCPFIHNWDRTDSDNDTVGDACDNCPSDHNTDQTDTDNDGIGDGCDKDDDNDGHDDGSDNCPLVNNPSQIDTDNDGIGDACDNCIYIANVDQSDDNQNGYGDSCDNNKDKDGDSVLDLNDNCIEVSNSDQSDSDGDELGDACDGDIDGDGVNNDDDNCPYLYNPLQKDINGDKMGDDCVLDSDGDGVYDSNDTCPQNKYLSTTSFSNYDSIDLYPGYSNEPKWKVKAIGREIYQFADTVKPVMLIGKQRYGSMVYSGTFYVPSKKIENYIGIVFSYVDNRKFYLLSWRSTTMNTEFGVNFKTSLSGLQLKVVNSITGPGQSLTEALWQSSTTQNQATVLWHDDNMTRWSNYTSYKWFLRHYATLNKIRFQLFDASSALIDSGDLYDSSYTGGRVGVYQFGQETVLWSDLKVQCLLRNQALYLDGLDDFVELTNVSSLNIQDSFTISIWVKISTDSLSKGVMPVVCTKDHLICLWIDNGGVYASYGNSTINSSSPIAMDEWFNILYIYDESEYLMKLYIDGQLSTKLIITEPIYLTKSFTMLYLGGDGFNYFHGLVDEMVFYNVALETSEIDDHVQLSSISKYPTFHLYGKLYYKMDDNAEGTYLRDKETHLRDDGLLNHHGTIYGDPLFKDSSQDFKRYHLKYPSS